MGGFLVKLRFQLKVIICHNASRNPFPLLLNVPQILKTRVHFKCVDI